MWERMSASRSFTFPAMEDMAAKHSSCKPTQYSKTQESESDSRNASASHLDLHFLNQVGCPKSV